MSLPLQLGDLLQTRGLITNAQHRYARQAQKITGESLGRILTRIGIISEYDLVHTLAEHLQLPYVDLTKEVPDTEILHRFNRNQCLGWRMLPLRPLMNANNEEVLLVVVCNQPDDQFHQAVLQASGLRPCFALAEESRIVSAIYNHFFFSDTPVENLLAREMDVLQSDSGKTVNPDKFINYLLLLALKRRATDVHIRPMSQGIGVAFRVDGVLCNEFFLPRELGRIITAIKLTASMDISEQRLPQDGRWTANLLDQSYDIRVSSLVTPYGENIVLRLLSQDKRAFSLDNLGFLPQDLRTIHQTFQEPHGLVLLTGPTGSGKTTTLVAGLISLDLLGKNVLTIENPIEYQVPLARQTEVNPLAGYDFSNAMRFFLRHDPDVIFIGEMRDEQTAQTAVTASTTGHLVLSTLHTNSAFGAIPRLRNLGLDTLTLAESLLCIVSQRLVRTICPYCRQEYEAENEELTYLGKQSARLAKGAGCAACNHTGYLGRTLIYEVLSLDRQLREMLERDARVTDMLETALAKGFTSMFETGVRKVCERITTVEELRRVLGRSQH